MLQAATSKHTNNYTVSRMAFRGKIGYEHCYPLVDFLVGKDVKVRIEAENGTVKKDIFTIKLQFITPEKSFYKYNPSISVVTLSNGVAAKSKDFNCSQIIYSHVGFEDGVNLIHPVQLNGFVHNGLRYDCFILYFNVQPPSIDENYFLDINGLVGITGPVKFPRLQFIKSIRK